MIIDFHTHIFPDSLAPRALAALVRGVAASPMEFKTAPCTDGTEKGLVRDMDKGGISRAVLLPVATKPSQAESINKWELGLGSERLIPFGAHFPGADSPAQLERLKEQGFRGIKLHGEFQGFYADDPLIVDVCRRCGELGLIVAFHAGMDYEDCENVRVTPTRAARLLDKLSRTTVVLAHMGGIGFEDEAARLLAGAQGLMVDTSFSAGRLSPSHMGDLIAAYGAEKVLFGTDSPWNSGADSAGLINAAGLSDGDRELIFHKNAERLLHLMS